MADMDDDRPKPFIAASLVFRKKRKADSEDEGGAKKTRSTATHSGYAPNRREPSKGNDRVIINREVNVGQRRVRNGGPRQGHGATRSEILQVSKLKDSLTELVLLYKNGQDLSPHFSLIRNRLHDIEFCSFMNQYVVESTKILLNKGLPAFFDRKYPETSDLLPYDIKADAEALFNRWTKQDFDPSLLRGIKVVKAEKESGKNRTSYRLDDEYPLKTLAGVFGNNGLVNGQWWPNRLCVLRDGGHGSAEAGVSGVSGYGANAIVVSSAGYKDEDKGITIKYCGTESRNSELTAHTNLLVQSYEKRNQIRVLRSENKNSKYAPSKGIRYDGLYVITAMEVLDPAFGMCRFTLERIGDQDPIRYEGVEARPTQRELDEFKYIKELAALS